MKRLLLFLLAAYIASYASFRATNSEIWAKDKQSYVMYTDNQVGRAAYYAWRPLAYLDNALTGRRSHLGPHR
jgi:hypothetical protein